MAAYTEYLRGRAYFDSRVAGWQEQAADAFRRAIDLDPDYAPPYAGLAAATTVNTKVGPHWEEGETFAKSLQDREVSLCAVGKRGREYFARRNYDIHRAWVDVFRDVQFPLAAEMADDIMERYVAGELDEVYLVFNEFKSAIQCTPTIERLLPVEPAEFDAGETVDDYIYEPDAQSLFHGLLPHYVQQIVFQALLESVAAEHAARMTAMDNETKNAGELSESLTLYMNKVRQASITSEILEVVSGAEALR